MDLWPCKNLIVRFLTLFSRDINPNSLSPNFHGLLKLQVWEWDMRSAPAKLGIDFQAEGGIGQVQGAAPIEDDYSVIGENWRVDKA
jgi:hypothetical protein